MKNFFYLCLPIFILVFFSGCHTINRPTPEFKTEKKEVILSFDDEPNAHGDTTARLLDVLKKYNITAMFALLGENAEKNPDLVRRIHEEGHIIINHGYLDIWAVGMDGHEFRENLSKGEAAITAALGEELNPRLYRPHGGFYRKWQRKIWKKQGWTMVGCDIRAYDANNNESKKKHIICEIIKKTEENKSGIIMLHGSKNSWHKAEAELEKEPLGTYNRTWIPDAVEEIIKELLERNYRFKVPVFD